MTTLGEGTLGSGTLGNPVPRVSATIHLKLTDSPVIVVALEDEETP